MKNYSNTGKIAIISVKKTIVSVNVMDQQQVLRNFDIECNNKRPLSIFCKKQTFGKGIQKQLVLG